MGSFFNNYLCAVKNILIISILSVYLISTTELHQLVKLPLLVEHFIQHKKQNEGLSLWGFLCMHYANEDDSTDDNEDRKLPFKSHSECSSLLVNVTPLPHLTEFIKPVFTQKKEFLTYNENFLTSSHISSVWQPPKSC